MTIRKTTEVTYTLPGFDSSIDDGDTVDVAHVPAHRDFREKYFQGFRSESTSK